jgi:RNA polymerase sigma factor (TIGR02999 family)
MAALAPKPGHSDSIPALPVQLSAGNREVEAQHIPQVYRVLRRLAPRYIRAEVGNHTLQAIALINEAYTRIVQQPQVRWQLSTHFLATPSQLVRHSLVDHSPARRAGKRAGLQRQVILSKASLQSHDRTIESLVLHEGFEHLTQFDPRKSRIFELHFSGGLNFEEIAWYWTSPTAQSSATGAWPELQGELSKQP